MRPVTLKSKLVEFWEIVSYLKMFIQWSSKQLIHQIFRAFASKNHCFTFSKELCRHPSSHDIVSHSFFSLCSMLQRTIQLTSSELFGKFTERVFHLIYRSAVSIYIPIWLIFIFSELFSWIPCIAALSTDVDNIDDVTEILDREPYYNKNAYPHLHLDKPTIIYIKMYIEGMSSFRAQTMDFQVDIYFQEMWVDKRLMHNSTRRILIKDSKLLNLIWHPDIYFANARTAEFHHVTQPNFLVWIYPNGTVWYDCRISLTVLCMQNLAHYPLDSQSCALRILSYAYNSEQLLILWNGHNPIEINEEIRMPDMKLKSIVHTLRNDTYATGVWSCALAEFHVDREIMHHVIQSYVPTALIVVISWFSFWLDVEAVPGRVSLSITTFLTLATQSSAARMALPQASYVKAIDIWMGMCMAFVFSAMIEFTVVNYCTRRKERNKTTHVKGISEQVQNLVAQNREKRMLKYVNSFYEISHCPDNSQSQASIEKKQIRELNQSPLLFRRSLLSSTKRRQLEERINRVEENRKYAQLIDRRSRIYFPLAFILFNIIYWTYYIKYAEGSSG